MPKETPIKQVEGKKDEWVTISHKGKVTLNPLSPKQSYAVVVIVPPIPIGVFALESMETQAASTIPFSGVSQVSNPTSSQGIMAAARASALVGAHTPLAVSSIMPPATQHSCNPPRRVEASEVKR